MTASTQKTTPLIRQWLLLQALSSRRFGMTVKEMAEEADVLIRTIRRDLLALKKAGFPIVEKEISSHGRIHWQLAPEFRSPSISFTWEEVIALYLARRHLDPLAGTILWESVNQAFRKIRASVGENVLNHLEKMSDSFHHIHFGASNYADKGEIIDSLMLAIEDRKLVLLSYHSLSSTESFTYEVAPYGIVFHHNSLYLVAFSTDHQEIRHFKIDRIDNADVTDLKYPRPANFDLQEHFATSFGVFSSNGEPHRVRIRFSPDVARIVEESRWHESQKLTRQPDGSLLAEFTLGNLTEIKSWVLSFGKKATVLEPNELREEILDEVREMLELMSEEQTK